MSCLTFENWAFGDRLADLPQRGGLRLARRKRRIDDEAAFGAFCERALDQPCERRLIAAVRQLRKHVPLGIRAKRVASAGSVREDGVDAAPRDQLECGEPVAARGAQRRQQFNRACRALRRDPGRRRRGRPRKQLEDRGGDDAERALGADEQLLQVVAGVVLAQAAQPVPYAPVGQHHLQPEHQLARVAVAQHVHAARVGRKVAADLAAALGRQRKRKQPIVPGSHALDLRQHAARFRGERIVERIDCADAVHPRQRNHDLGPRAGRHRAAAQAGISTLRNDAQAPPCGQAHRLRHFLGRTRPHDTQGLAAILPPPVGEKRVGIGTREHVARADDGGELFDNGRFNHAAMVMRNNHDPSRGALPFPLGSVPATTG